MEGTQDSPASKAGTGLGRGNAVNVYLVFSSAVFACLCYTHQDLVLNPRLVIAASILFSLIGAVSLAFNKVRCLQDRNWISFEVLYYAVFWIMHFGIAVLWLVEGGMPEISSFARHGYYLYPNLPRVALLAACGGLSFTLAFLLFAGMRERHIPPNNRGLWYVPWKKAPTGKGGFVLPPDGAAFSVPAQMRILRLVQLASVLVSFVALAAMVATAGADFFSSPYSTAVVSYPARLAKLVFFPFFTVGFATWLLCGFMARLNVTWALYGVYYAGVLLFYIVLGQRSPVATVGAIALVLVGVIRYNVRWWQLVLALVMASAVLLFVGEARTSEERSLSSFVKKGVEAHHEQESRWWFLGGMKHYSETVFPTLVMSVEVVPKETPYFNGYFTFRGLLGVVPFYTTVFPFLSREERYSTSSEYMTWLYFGNSAVRTGMGTTVIVESYLDFGLPGVMATMFLVGALGAFSYRRIRSRSVAVEDLVLYAILTSNLVMGARFGFATTLARGVIWPLCAYYLLKALARMVLASPSPGVDEKPAAATEGARS